MKGKNSAFYNGLRHFFEKSVFSEKERVVICFLSLIIELWNRIFFLPSLDSKEYNIFSLELWNRIFFLSSLGSNGERTGWWDTPLFLSLYAFWKVIIVCVLVLFPVMLILGIILWFLLVKNIRKLKGINQQRGHTIDQQNNPVKNNREKIICFFIVYFWVIFLLNVFFPAGVVMLILEFYYFIFKRVRTYRKVRRALKRVR